MSTEQENNFVVGLLINNLQQRLDLMNAPFESSYDEDYCFSKFGAFFEQYGYRLKADGMSGAYIDPANNRGTYEYYSVPSLDRKKNK